MSTAAQQIAILLAETLFVGAVILTLFHLRGRLGLLPLAVFVGSNQYLQTILSSSHYLRFGDTVMVSPGSVVLFPAALFAVLLIYHQDGIPQARALIYGILIANATLTFLSVFTSLQINIGDVANLLQLPEAIFAVDPRVFLVGTLILILDAVLIAVVYELLVNRIGWLPMILCLPLTMVSVLIIDAVVFTATAFAGHPELPEILRSQLITKPLAGLVYGLMLFGYLRTVGTDPGSHATAGSTNVWAILTYRERFEILRQQKKAQEQAFERERSVQRKALSVAEGRYRTLFQTMSDGLLVVDTGSGRIIDLNRAFTELTSYTRDELLGLTLAEADLFDATMIAGMAPAVSAEWETRLKRPDREPLHVDLQLTRFAHGGGRTLVLAIRDITGRKAAEQAAQQKEVNRLKDRFISTVSHELRTPLASIYGSLSLVDQGKMGELPSKAERYISVALRNSRRLRWLINDILDFQKIESGLLTMSLEPHDLVSLAGQAIEDNHGFAERYGIAVKQLGDEPPLEALVDRRWFQQILTNLLSNAVKHSPEGEAVSLEITTESDHIRIAVSDRGPGIPEHFRDQIFQPFSQAQLVSKPEDGSTGLGLSIAKALAEQMNGSLAFTARKGGGTTFTFDLPRHGAEPRDETSGGSKWLES